MFERIRQWLKDRRDRQRLADEIRPESFRAMAAELRELAEAAGRLWPEESKFQAKIKRIKAEMEQLDSLAARPEFLRLPIERRTRLRQSLIKSREQLIETVQAAPAPTDWVQ